MDIDITTARIATFTLTDEEVEALRAEYEQAGIGTTFNIPLIDSIFVALLEG